MQRHQRRVVFGAVSVALFLIVYPPWRATAVRTTTRYANLRDVEPLRLIDTVTWALSFAPFFASPRAPVGATAQGLTMLATDSTGHAERDSLRQLTEEFERRYHVPELLRASGAAWRDSVLMSAGIASVTGYEVHFAIDQRRLAFRLALVGLVAALTAHLLSRRRSRAEAWDH